MVDLAELVLTGDRNRTVGCVLGSSKALFATGLTRLMCSLPSSDATCVNKVGVKTAGAGIFSFSSSKEEFDLKNKVLGLKLGLGELVKETGLELEELDSDELGLIEADLVKAEEEPDKIAGAEGARRGSGPLKEELVEKLG